MGSIGYDVRSFAVSVWYVADTSPDGEAFIVYFLDDADTPALAYRVTVSAQNGAVVDTHTPEP